MRQYNERELNDIATQLHHWPITASGTVGYRTAEVTLGGVDTRELSSASIESKSVAGLYFIAVWVSVNGGIGGVSLTWAVGGGHQRWAVAHAHPPSTRRPRRHRVQGT